MALTPEQQAEQNKLVERYIELLQRINGLTTQQAKIQAEGVKNAGSLNKEVERLEDYLNDINSSADYLFKSFRETTGELKNQNILLNAGRSVFKNLTGIAQDLKYAHQGISDLSEKDLKKKIEAAAKSKDQLKDVVSQLGTSQGIFKQQRELDVLTSLALDKDIQLSASQKSRLQTLNKEKDLYEASKNALKEGIPLLEKELGLNTQIVKTREKLGGVAQAAGKVLSEFGGSLSRYLNINEATEAVEDYNKKLIDGALNNRKVQDELIKREKEKERIQNALDSGIIRSTSAKQKAQEALKKLEQEQWNIKQQAIASVDTLGNKFKSLGVFVSGLGSSLKKLFTDPVTILTTLVSLGFKANNQVVELGKSFGISAKSAENIRQDVAAFARSTGDTFLNTDRLLKAQSELSEQMGIAVKFSNEELATFAKLTELTGLSAQEAGNLAKASAAAGMSTESYTKGIREGAFSAMVATKTHFSQREIMQDISKLSSGILVKFQGNPKALAQAVIEAKKLGSNLDQINKIGDSLLEWESSIQNELEAELMTGKQINLERARAAALSGDQLSLTREISSQVGTLNDFQNMNVLAQSSLAKAFGLSRDEMAEMLMKQEAVNKYGEEAAQLNKEQLEDMKRQGLSASEYLQKQEQQRSAQQKFQEAMVKLQDIIGNLVAGPVGQLLDALADMVGFVMKIFGNPIVSGFFNIIAKIAETLSDIGSTIGGKVVFGLAAAALFLPKLAAGFGGLLGSVAGVGKGITSMFKGGEGEGFFSKIKTAFKGGLTGTDKTKELAEKGTEGAEKTSAAADKAKGGNAEGFKTRMQNIADGIKAFADGKVIKGALTLPVAGLGLILFIPGVLGAKIIEQVNGEKFQSAMYGIAYGISDFGKNVSVGDLGKLSLGGIALTLFSLGVPGMLLLQLVKGEKFQEAMKGIAGGISDFGKNVTLSALGKLSLAGAALTLFSLGVPGLLLLQLVNGTLIEKVLGGVGKGVAALGKAISDPKIILGVAAFTVSMIGLGYALNLATPAIKAFGEVITAVFSGIATVITAAANGISTIFTTLQNVDVMKLLAIGPALLGIGAGLAALGGGGVVAAIGKFLGGDPVKKIQALAESGDGLQKTATGLQGVAGALIQVSSALSTLDIDKLEKLSEFSTKSPIESAIEGITDFITSPIKAISSFISPEPTKPTTAITSETIKTSETISKSIATETIKKPGAGEKESVSQAELVAAINGVREEVKKIFGKNIPIQATIKMDSKTVGSTLVQGSYKTA